jgi:hypothetical protein
VGLDPAGAACGTLPLRPSACLSAPVEYAPKGDCTFDAILCDSNRRRGDVGAMPQLRKYEAEGGRRAQATQASGRSIEGGRALLKKRRAREVIWEREEELVVKESEEEKKGSPPTQYVEGVLASWRVEATVQSKILALLSRSLVQRIRGSKTREWLKIALPCRFAGS